LERDLDTAFAPPTREFDHCQAQALAVDSEPPVEGRSLADGSTINLGGLQLVGIVEESDVDLDGQTCLGWKLVLTVGPEDRLASDPDDVVVLSSVGRGAQDVGEVLLLLILAFASTGRCPLDPV